MLPTYLIAGTVRSGTTSLHRALRRHPEVFAPGEKELHFFDRQFDRGVGWYESLFADAPGTGPVGEATPNYVYDDHAVERMAGVVPDARVVVLLRDPVERAYSQYWMQRSAHHETLDFADAVAAEPDRLTSPGPERAGLLLLRRPRPLRRSAAAAAHALPGRADAGRALRGAARPARGDLPERVPVHRRRRRGRVRRAWTSGPTSTGPTAPTGSAG